METDVRKNPGLLKLDLYCKGARLAEDFLVESEGGRKILVTHKTRPASLDVLHLPIELRAQLRRERLTAGCSPRCSEGGVLFFFGMRGRRHRCAAIAHRW